MINDSYNLKGKSDTELHQWLSGHESTSIEYLAGIKELMKRNDAPVNRRELIAMGLAFVFIVVVIFAIVIMYE